ncbi:MAG: LexA family transcriptional regulator [Calditrichaeota bacterium]|nr:MAG: LexA family transcriptional regulator [Calditrichota bacterium]
MAKIKILSQSRDSELTEKIAPIFTEQVAAGFPSPADDYLEGNLDLNKYLVKHPVATYFVRVTGDSMVGAGIHEGDILIVDRSLEPVSRRIVIAVVDGELTVKRLIRRNGKVMLMPENDKYKPIEIKDEVDLEIWGVVTTVLHGV